MTKLLEAVWDNLFVKESNLSLRWLRAHEADKGLAVTEKVLEMDPNFPWALAHYAEGLCKE